MKFMIGVDLEGVACAVGACGKTLTESADYEFARRQATREADAAARALFDAGAGRVVVWDNHGGLTNLDYDVLDERCEIVLGSGGEHRWPGLDESFAGVLMVGYHAMEGTPDAVLCHTFNSRDNRATRVNGTEVGEMAIDAAVAGERGVPAVFVASDEAGAAEARRFMPWIETVATKRGFGWNLALSKHPRRAVAEIYEAVGRAVGRLGEMKPFAFETPITFELALKRQDAADAVARSRDGWTRVDAYTVGRQLARLSEYF
jgi:D-amino peptidase